MTDVDANGRPLWWCHNRQDTYFGQLAQARVEQDLEQLGEQVLRVFAIPHTGLGRTASASAYAGYQRGGMQPSVRPPAPAPTPHQRHASFVSQYLQNGLDAPWNATRTHRRGICRGFVSTCRDFLPR